MSIQIRELISTTNEGIELKSYVCLPEDTSDDKPVPAILVAPEWWGWSNTLEKSPNALLRQGLQQLQWTYMVRAS